jgi:hypothetical protein
LSKRKAAKTYSNTSIELRSQWLGNELGWVFAGEITEVAQLATWPCANRAVIPLRGDTLMFSANMNFSLAVQIPLRWIAVLIAFFFRR